jgi:hypothetical protein
MTQLALVVVLLLASVGTAFAECAWVLWFTSGKTSANVLPVEAYAMKDECEAAMQDRRTSIEDHKRKYPGEFAFCRCLPDTVDPRGPKAR